MPELLVLGTEPTLLFEADTPPIPVSVSADGILLFFVEDDLWHLEIADPSKATVWLESEAAEVNASFSPDGDGR